MAVATDHELVERSRRRDAAAFGVLVARHQQLVIGVALARCRDPILAEDIAQDAFVAAWGALDHLRDGERVGTWVAGIARNLARGAVRLHARRARVTAEARDELARIDAPDDAERALLEREDRALLARALAALPDRQRAVLERYYVDGEDLATIAARTNQPEINVRKQLSRARAALRMQAGDARARGWLALGAPGKTLLAMTTKQLAITLAAALALAGGALWLGLRRHGDVAPTAAATSTALPANAASTTTAPGAAIRPPSADGGADAAPHVARLPDRASRDALVAAIRTASARRGAAPAEAATTGGMTSGAPAEPELDKEYIRGAVHEIIPLLTDCYEEGIARDPAIAGDVVVDFTIEGEPGVGAVIGDSTIDGKHTTLADPAVRECIQETMYALKLDPPKGGGRVQVHYPFAFANTPDDGSGSAAR